MHSPEMAFRPEGLPGANRLAGRPGAQGFVLQRKIQPVRKVVPLLRG